MGSPDAYTQNMGIEHQQVPHDWNYFFCLEEDIIGLSRWIEFSAENEGVYSILIRNVPQHAT